jgi:hypothetical protein
LVVKAVHGKILMATGVVHSLVLGVPLYWEKWTGFARAYFLNAAPHRLDLSKPLYSGLLDLPAEAAIWFFIGGVALFVLGQVVHHIEISSRPLPRFLGWELLALSVLFTWMIPISGFPIFLFPQAVFMIVRQSRVSEA